VRGNIAARLAALEATAGVGATILCLLPAEMTFGSPETEAFERQSAAEAPPGARLVFIHTGVPRHPDFGAAA
jgi:hypothetical protein